MPQYKNIINNAKSCYLVGIKGVGMTALAEILKGSGKKVSGSDTVEKFFTDKVLRKLKIKFKEGFKGTNLRGKIDLIIHSTAFDPKAHPEILRAKKLNIPIISYPKAVAELFNNNYGIAVSGTHGKTTTSSLIACAMKSLNYNPTALIGSRVSNWGSNALIPRKKLLSSRKEYLFPPNSSPFFVIEADEHQNKLRYYFPWSIVITNIDYDHPDYYSEAEYYQAFKDWVARWHKKKSILPKIGVFNGDDQKTERLLRELNLSDSNSQIILTFGKKTSNNIQIVSSRSNPRGSKISLRTNYHGIKKILLVETKLLGEHNAYNLAAAYGFVFALMHVTIKQPFSDEKISQSLSSFSGSERRMQFIGKRHKVLVYDDYAHHPSEIKATLSSFKKSFPKHNLIVIFQPHTFTRTKAFLKGFARSLTIADKVFFLPIYGSAREKNGKVSSLDIAKAVGARKSRNFSSQKSCLEILLKSKFSEPTILITMGAGDGWKIGKEFLGK